MQAVFVKKNPPYEAGDFVCYFLPFLGYISKFAALGDVALFPARVFWCTKYRQLLLKPAKSVKFANNFLDFTAFVL
jgi:hypothetical protein